MIKIQRLMTVALCHYEKYKVVKKTIDSVNKKHFDFESFQKIEWRNQKSFIADRISVVYHCWV